MTCHIVVSRINPSVTVDAIRFCDVVDGKAAPIEDSIAEHFSSIPAISELVAFTSLEPEFLVRTIPHSDISKFVQIACASGSTTVDYFDNNLVLVLSHE
ncbi:hypothetical protein [Dipodfec virus UOA04_Rod_660]|nr:hypothetical protein [Dipodfec virus UOA04_Rod_660]